MVGADGIDGDYDSYSLMIEGGRYRELVGR